MKRIVEGGGKEGKTQGTKNLLWSFFNQQVSLLREEVPFRLSHLHSGNALWQRISTEIQIRASSYLGGLWTTRASLNTPNFYPHLIRGGKKALHRSSSSSPI